MQTKLLPHNELVSLVECTLSVLETEHEDYRPCVPLLGIPGGLLDFCTGKKIIPTIIVPDLHARPDFFSNILSFKPKIPNTSAEGCTSVLNLMQKGEVRLVCVGDGLHSELRKDRWLKAFDEFEKGVFTGKAIVQEMEEGLSLMEMVMRCKCDFPEFFHFLKGNHENILNTTRHGNHPFRKFAQEGEMVKLFMSEYYGDDVLHLYACMEDSLPLCALCPNCIVSHAEPIEFYSREQLIEGLTDDSLIEGLTWTGNDESTEGCVQKMLEELLPDYPEAVYFGGHRPVKERYATRQKGKFIQIHNPRQQNVAVVNPFYPFDAETDIIAVKEI